MWVSFTRRTEDPKLAWLEMKLDQAGIPHRRNGRSFHAPILEVQECDIERAWLLLPARVDNAPDDDPRWERELAKAGSHLASRRAIL